MRKENKLLLVVVEGINDQIALLPLNKFYTPHNFEIIFTRGDITSAKTSTRQNIKSCLQSHIKNFLNKNKLHKQDILKVFFITDTDGTFIPDANIEAQSSCNKFKYLDDKIICKDVEQAKKRNKRKKDNILELLKTKEIYGISLEIFFMSCNLDHVITGEANCSVDQKSQNAEEFSAKYATGTGNEVELRQKFENFFLDRLIEKNVPEDYFGSWKHIQLDVNSLQRCSNFYLALKEIDELC